MRLMRLTEKYNLSVALDYIKTISGKGIGRTLFIRFLIFALIPMIIIGVVSINNGVTTIKEARLEGLTVVAMAKQERLIEYFRLIETNLRLQSELVNTINFLDKLKVGSENYNKSLKEYTRSYQWANIEDKYAADISRFLTAHNYIDILLIDNQGNILYSVRKDDDLGRNLFNGKYKNTRFSHAAQSAIHTGRSVYSDMEFYAPYQNKLSSFYMQAVVNGMGEKIGLLAIHLSNDPITKIMNEVVSFGNTGETYLVGKDLLIRSKTKYNNEIDILRIKVETQQIKNWFNKVESKNVNYHKSALYKNYRNISVLGVQIPFEITGIQMLVVSEINEQEAYLSANRLTNIVIIITLITFFIVIISSIYSARVLTRPIEEISNWAREISVGNLFKKNIITPDNEIGILNKTFCELVDSLQSVTWIMESFSVGDLSTKMEKRSKNDILIIALTQLRNSMRAVVKQANEISRGEYENNFVVRGERDELGNALVNMAKNIQQAKMKNNEQDWMKTGQTGLSEVMRGEQGLGILANNIIMFLCQHISSSMGIIYIAEENLLRLSGHYACNDNEVVRKNILFGDGMVGQCAVNRNPIIFEDIPDDYIKIKSGLGESLPKQILIIPFVYNDKVYGVMELCFLRKTQGRELEFLEIVDESIAIAISTVFSRNQINETLYQVQEKSEELQAQQEELKASNEELEEQTQLLRQSEEELKLANKELESKSKSLRLQKNAVEEKNKEVELKAKELASASKYKSEFLANMSHELRTPLNSLLILSKMLKDNSEGNLNEKQIEWANVITNSGSELLELINEILDLSKVESGKMEVNISHVDIDELIKSIVEKFDPLAKNKNIKLIVDNKIKQEINFTTDYQRLSQILKNLLSNAIKFTDVGEVTFSLYLAKDEAMSNKKHSKIDGMLALSVADTGIGISKKKMDVIFKAFQQEDGSISRKYGGTGLGLSISKELASLLNGEITVKSSPDGGCVFTLYVPISYELVDHVTSEFTDISNNIDLTDEINEGLDVTSQLKDINVDVYIPDDRCHITNNKKTVLIIEDNKDFAALLLELVRTQNYLGLVAGGGRSGIKLAEEFKPTAILLDIGLPDMSGEDVLTYFKAHVMTRHIPIHIISAMMKENKYLQKGAVGFLTKPVNMDSIKKLFTKINAIVDNKTKTILLIEDNKDSQIAISALIENDFTKVLTADDIESAKKILISQKIDCVLLDIGLPDSYGINFISELKDDFLEDCPLIIHTGRELNDDELAEINRAASSVIIKCAQSHDRLLDETMLFLHHVDSRLPKNQRKVIHSLHDSEKIFLDKKIMIVDDDMRNLFALSGLLSERGIKVVMAENGQDAVEKLLENPDFDLVLMDIMMPVMDGYEAIRLIRKNKNTCLIPIICLTAKAMQEDRQMCINSGANDYLTKPVDIEKLLSILRVWLHT